MRLILLFLIAMPAQGLPTAARATDLPVEQQAREEEEDKDGLNIYRHNHNYFISGNPDTKVQISFKIQLIHDFDLYAAYTQTNFWELGKKSNPFSDLNFNPEIFYRMYLKHGIMKGLDFGIYEHKSNGREKEQSRSWDRSYVTVRTEFDALGKPASWDTKLFYLYNLDATNEDIRAKYGFIETTIAFEKILNAVFDDATLQLRVIPGGKLDFKSPQGSQEMNFLFRLPIRRFNPQVFLQVFNGQNENQLHYKTRRTSYRAGFAL